LSISAGVGGAKREADGEGRRSWSPVLAPALDGNGYWAAGQGRVGRLGWDGKLAVTRVEELGEVTGLAEDAAARGVLWLCEIGGKLWRYEAGRLVAIPLRRELLVMDAVSLVDDGLGRLWMGTSNGILVFSKQELVTAAEGRTAGANGRRIGMAHGMRNAECNTLTNGQSAIRTREGWVWFATEGGAAGIDPRRFGANPHVPAAGVEEVLFDGVARDVEGGEVEVGPGEGGVEFRYTGVTMVMPELVRFRYKLEGFDRGFVEAGDRRSAFYTNLPPGRYRFVLEALNSDGRAGAPVEIGFRLRPWFYQTLWFQGLCGFGALAGAAGLFRWRMRAVRERNAELERAVAARTAELEVAAGEAQKAAAMKSEFLATMSHEIRTPMHGVIGMSSLLLSMPLPAEAAEYAGAIRSSAGALLTVINDILDFSKVDSGTLELERAPFRLEQCVEEALDVMAPGALEKGLDLACWIDEDVPREVIGDAGRVRQVLLNVVGNAVKFTAAGEVEVRVERGERAGLVRFRVRDTGIGIPADRVDRLFTPFTQGDSSTTRHYGGTGLGLAICRRLCELMGGRIGVESVAGRGSTFTFTVELEGGAATEKAEAWLAGKRVLLAERECPTREVIRGLLTGAGAVVETVSTEGAARARALEEPGFDVAIAGRGMGGIRLAARQVLLHPGSGRAEEAGADGILTLPVKRRRLFEVIRDVLEGLPAGCTSERRRPEFDEHLAKRAPLRILLAEDNEVNQRLALRVLAKMGYQADVAKNGVEVLAALREREYDLVLMDIQMPRMDGFETTRRIREEWPGAGVPQVVAMTANAIAGDREACLAAGMDDYLSKPIEIAALQAAIERAHAAATGTGK
jgi:signal transduction histidine kinase/CheY-like chemotaxis protein